MYKITNKTYQPFNLFCGNIESRKYIIVEKLDKQLERLEKLELIKIKKM